MRRKTLPRRAFLQGAGGIAIALPFLEIMGLDQAHAAGVPKRFIYTFQGQSLGADNQFANFFVPPATGNNFPLSVGLAPLGVNNVKNDVTVVSGLRIPQSGPGARDFNFHPVAHFAQLLGAKALAFNGANGEGADQIAARTLGAGAKYQSVAYCGQPLEYHDITADGQRNVASYMKNTAGRFVEVYPEISPLKAFNSMFTGLTTGGGVDPAVAAAQAKRKSILDFVLGQRANLVKNLGVTDASRLSDHLDQLRDLERSLASTSACTLPLSPGADPAQNLATSSGETRRNRAFMDIIHLAIVCDLTRVVNHMFTNAHCFMSTAEVGGLIAGANTDVHEMGHTGGINLPRPAAGTPFVSYGGVGSHNDVRSHAMAIAQAWAVNQFSYLVARLKASPEGGGSVLDNCAMMMTFEGGHGGGTDDGADVGSHSTENMSVLLAGGAGGLKHGRHLVMPNVHPAQVTISALQAIGAPTTLGQVSGALPALFAV